MPGNTTGTFFRLTTFGESHGTAIGGVIDGCPAGLTLDNAFIRDELERRKPRYAGSTDRKEDDIVEFLSGIYDDKTIGSPIAFLVKNTSARPADYNKVKDVFRPSHADYTYKMKYGTGPGLGGSRASGRETVARVIGGAIAKLYLKKAGIRINAFVSQIGEIVNEKDINAADIENVAISSYGCPDRKMEIKIGELIRETAKRGDTLGGAVTCVIRGVPPGLGEPVFDKLQADLAKAQLSIGSAKAFEYGLGFRASGMTGSNYNDQMASGEGKIVFLSNHDGGIQGGISNGEDIMFRVGFKPVPSIKTRQSTVNLEGEPQEIAIGGRHDTCHVPRLVVVVEAMAALVLADHHLRNKNSRITL